MRRFCDFAGLRHARAAIVVASVAALTGCAVLRMVDAQAPTVTVSSLSLVDISLSEQRFEVGLQLQNPNHFPLPITQMDYTLQLNGERFASGTTPNTFTVPSLGEELIKVTVSSNLLGNLAQLRRWRQNPPDRLDYRVDGGLSVEGLPARLPFEHSGSVNVRMP